LNLKITKEYNQITDGVRNYINFNDTLLIRLKDSCENLVSEISAVTKRMREISEIYNSLYLISDKSNDNPTVKDTYRMLSNVMDKWADAHSVMNAVIDIDMLDYFNYIKKEYSCFKEVFLAFML
jgi:hypothetical protein